MAKHPPEPPPGGKRQSLLMLQPKGGRWGLKAAKGGTESRPTQLVYKKKREEVTQMLPKPWA